MMPPILAANFGHKEMRTVAKALKFAADKYCQSRRKDSRSAPAINHLIQVLEIMLSAENAPDINVVCAAVLHDIVEDGLSTIEDINEQFGVGVAQLVQEVPDDTTLPRHVRKLIQIDNAHQLSPGARLIKLADKTSNVWDIVLHGPRTDRDELWAHQYIKSATEFVNKIRGTSGSIESLFDRLCESCDCSK